MRKQGGKKYRRSFWYIRMPVSILKRINSPRIIIIKCSNGDKVKILKLSREETSHIKNQKFEMAYFSTAELEEPEARQQLVMVEMGSGGGRLAYCKAILLPRTIRKAGKSIF